MSNKYLLPCRCGQQIIVEPREAGQTSVCPCGQSFLIPTMLEMARLEPAPAEASPPAEHVWGWQHGLVLSGVALVVMAVALACLVRWFRPVAPIDAIDPEALRQSAGKLTPLQTWHYWGLMKQGLDRRTDQIYEAALTQYHIWESVAGVGALAGVALIGVGVGIGKRRQGDRERGRRGDRERGRQGETPAT